MLVPFIVAVIAAWLFFHFYAQHRGPAPVRPLIPVVAGCFVLLLGSGSAAFARARAHVPEAESDRSRGPSH